MTEQTTIEQPEQIAELHTAVDDVTRELAAFDKIGAGLNALRAAHPENLVVDVTTPAGMRDAIAARAAWRDPRVALEKARKAAKAPVLALGKQIDTFAASLEARLRIGEDNYDAQIQVEIERKAAEKKAAEEAEAARVQAIKDDIALHFTSKPARMFGKSAAEIGDAIARMEAHATGGNFEDFREDATTAKTHALEILRTMHSKAVAVEAEEERQRALAAENARQAAELAEQRRQFEEQQERTRAEQRQKEQAEAQERQAREDAARREREALEEKRREAQAAEDRARKAAQDLEDARRADAQAEAERLVAERRAEEDRQRAEALEQERQHAAEAEAARLKKVQAEERARAKAAKKLAAAQKAGPRLLAALKALVQAYDDADGHAGADIAVYEAALKEAHAAVTEAEAE